MQKASGMIWGQYVQVPVINDRRVLPFPEVALGWSF
jgi:hypothetical protein